MVGRGRGRRPLLHFAGHGFKCFERRRFKLECGQRKNSPCTRNNSEGNFLGKSNFAPVPDSRHKEPSGDLTQILQAVNQRIASADELLPLVYDELRVLAASRMARESNTQTL